MKPLGKRGGQSTAGGHYHGLPVRAIGEGPSWLDPGVPTWAIYRSPGARGSAHGAETLRPGILALPGFPLLAPRAPRVRAAVRLEPTSLLGRVAAGVGLSGGRGLGLGGLHRR